MCLVELEADALCMWVDQGEMEMWVEGAKLILYYLVEIFLTSINNNSWLMMSSTLTSLFNEATCSDNCFELILRSSTLLARKIAATNIFKGSKLNIEFER